jgi:hypothetical protein
MQGALFALSDSVALLLQNMLDKAILSLTQYTMMLLCPTGLAGGKLCERAVKRRARQSCACQLVGY